MDLTSVPKSIDDALRVQRKYVIPRACLKNILNCLF